MPDDVTVTDEESRTAAPPARGASELLAEGERAAFHGPPAAAVRVLEEAVVAAQAEEKPLQLHAAAWLLGVALGAAGRYGGALTVLVPLVEGAEAPGARPEAGLFGGFAAATVASVHRQLGRHAEGRAWDERCLDLSAGPEVEFDGHLGLAADAVGLADADEARARLADAETLAAAGDATWWRQRVRLDWVRAEVSLLGDRPEDAARAAARAVAGSRAAGAPRHEAKSLLFEGVAHVSAGREREARGLLAQSAEVAGGLGALPLVWPAQAVLAALLAAHDPAAARTALAGARSAVRAIAGGLPPDLRDAWRARPDVAHLLAD